MSAFSVVNLSVHSAEKKRLDGLSFSIPKGARVAIIGPNGAGKSTLLQALLKLIPAEYDGINIEGQALATLSHRELARLVSYVAQHHDLTASVSVYDWCEMARFPYKKWGFGLDADDHMVILAALTKTQTLAFKDRLLTQLSGGELQRVYIAGALCQQTPCIFLDEPSNFLDPKHSHEVMRLIKTIAAHEEKTVLCVTHDLNQVTRYFSHCLAIKAGRVQFFGPAQSVMNAANLNSLYDYSFMHIRQDDKEFYW